MKKQQRQPKDLFSTQEQTDLPFFTQKDGTPELPKTVDVRSPAFAREHPEPVTIRLSGDIEEMLGVNGRYAIYRKGAFYLSSGFENVHVANADYNEAKAWCLYGKEPA